MTLPALIEVIVSNAITKSGSNVYGNIVCGAVVQVDHSSPLGTVPGQPGFGTVTAVNGDCLGIFPKPAVLTASQQQTTPVLPSQQIPVTYNAANQGSTDATGAVLNENFDQVTPATGSATLGTITSGQTASGSFQVTIPSLSARQSNELSEDYQTRLGSVDGRLFTSSAELTFTDIFQQSYQPLDFSSFSTLQIPRLSASITGPSCIVPGSQVSYQVSASNIGTGTATSTTAVVTLPDTTSQTLTFPQILPAASFAGTVLWTAQTLPTKSASETTSAYLARLVAADAVTVPPTTASVTWRDSTLNAYGAIDQKFDSVHQRLPILSVTPNVPATVLPNQSTTFNFAVNNSGGGNALQANIAVKRTGSPDLSVPAFSAPAGQTVNPSVALRLPAIAVEGPQEGDAQYLSRLQTQDNQTLALNASTTWTDKVGNIYGPTDNTFSTNQILPILTFAATGPVNSQTAAVINYTLSVQNIGHADARPKSDRSFA